MNNSSRVVSIYGPPGAGKGTQARLLEARFSFVHFDTGSYIERILYSEQAEGGEDLAEKRKKFEEGDLLDSLWVLDITRDAVRRFGDSGLNLVFSGSPRTELEAFGDEDTKGLLEILDEVYGKENMDFVFLDISEKESVRRNSKRTICSVCSLPILGKYEPERCPFCEGELRTRTLDKPEIIEDRFEEFEDKTLPVLEGLEERGYEVKEVDGQQSPYKVHEEVLSILNLEKLNG